jgi:hypothetical protein
MGQIKVTVTRRGAMQGRFAFLMVTTLERLLLNGRIGESGHAGGAMQMLIVERNLRAILGVLFAALRGRLGRPGLSGVRIERGDEIHIEGNHSNVILDGEMFQAHAGRPIVLRPTAPVPFLRLAA